MVSSVVSSVVSSTNNKHLFLLMNGLFKTKKLY